MSVPMMKVSMELHIPIATINPNLEAIQVSFAKSLNSIVEIHKDIPMWGQSGNIKQTGVPRVEFKDKEIRNYYKNVSEQKEIVRVFMGLQGAMYMLQPDVTKLLKEYLQYSYLWVEDREDLIIKFCEQNPLIVEINEKFTEYVEEGERIRALPDVHNIGAIRILMGKFFSVTLPNLIPLSAFRQV